MPFVQIYLPQALDDSSRKDISLSIHESLVAIFGIPENDYFQVIHEIRPADLLYPSAYLGVSHGSQVVYIQIIARQGRTVVMKEELYRSIAEKIASRTVIRKDDVIIVLVENTSENWSFGQGVAQMVDPDWRKAESEKTPEPPVSRRQLLAANTGERTLTGFQAHEVRIAAGQKAGLHFHPCPVTGYIVSGTALVQVEGSAPQVLTAGQAFYEPAMTRILHFDNHSDTEPLTFCAFYLLNGEQGLIEMIHE
jgi:quercetin dioxygenase-like cupin family protein